MLTGILSCGISTRLSLQKWNESGFRPPLCTYRLNWARRTSWGWWDDWDDTVLQTQDSRFEPWRSEAEHATSRSRRLPTILTFTRGWGRNNFVSFKPPRPGTEPRTLAWKAAVLTTTLGPPPPTITACVCTNEIYRSQWDLNPVPPGSELTTLPTSYPGNTQYYSLCIIPLLYKINGSKINMMKWFNFKSHCFILRKVIIICNNLDHILKYLAFF